MQLQEHISLPEGAKGSVKLNILAYRVWSFHVMRYTFHIKNETSELEDSVSKGKFLIRIKDECSLCEAEWFSK